MVIPFPVKPVAIPAVLLGDVGPVKPVSPAQAAPDAVQPDPSTFVPGQKYVARVEARLSNGLSAVSIEGKLLHMRLPAAATPGSQLELTLITHAPRLKFLLPGHPAGGDNPATFSSIGKFISQLLSQVSSSFRPVVKSPAPLLPAPPTSSTQLPQPLQQAVTQSGLFYEAHLANWIGGKTSLQQIRQEPQGRLAPLVTAGEAAGSSPVASQTLPLVQHQLQVLETGLIQWRGEIWPNQTMEWDIAEHPPEHAANEPADSASRWQTRVHFQLPKLGAITALLTIDRQGVQIKLDTGAPAAAAYLDQARAALATAMQAAGLSVQTLEIQQDDASQTGQPD
ncbi:flagellar hook-length control protein FliK [Nitrosomonas sp. ANs5]|uniref:flagellar hook-length control protein FliK n=1 Tax=Nitrosomonas sp. ANs5 TaxID=3423941 RepID=UPI003D32A110